MESQLVIVGNDRFVAAKIPLETQLGLWRQLRGEGLAAFNAHLKAGGVEPLELETN